MLARLVSPHSLANFVEALERRKPLVSRAAGRDLTDIFSLDLLGEVLNTAPLPHEQVLLVSGGRYQSAIDRADYLRRMKEGATLVLLDGQQWSAPLRELCAQLANRLGCSVRVNVYYSQAGRRGYLNHYDTHDVLILQVSGTKRWKLSERTTEDPLFSQKQHDKQPPLEPIADELLHAGDVLYLPRGYWHETIAEEEQSLHLTVGLRPPTGIDFAAWIADELRERSLWRRHIPTHSDAEGSQKPMPAAFARHCAELLSDLATWAAEKEIALHYWEHRVASDRDPSPFRLNSIFRNGILTTADIVRRPQTQRYIITTLEEGALRLVVWGRELLFDSRCKKLIQHLFESTEIRLADLHAYAGLSFDEVADVVSGLAREGIVELVTSARQGEARES
jgi:ribosomal protein L16 Arg81 hydroxylase